MDTLNNILTAVGCVIIAGLILGVMWLLWLIAQVNKAIERRRRSRAFTFFNFDIEAHSKDLEQEALHSFRKEKRNDSD